VFLWLVFVAHFVAERYILQQKCLKGQIATMCSVTDRQTDGQQDDVNSQSYCVAVRSAKHGTLGVDRLFTDINIAGKRDHWPTLEDISLYITLSYLILPS